MNRIKELRLEKKLTQSQLAHYLKINQTAVGKYEREELEPNIKTLLQLSAFFNVSVDYLIGNSDDLGTIAISPSPALELTAEERELVDTFRRMTKETQAITLDTVHSLAGDNERGKIVLNKRA